MTLNHERYKDYFYQFGSVNVGLFTAAHQYAVVKQHLPLFAFFLNGFWFYVLFKIACDISVVSEKLKAYESTLAPGDIKISTCRSGLPGASVAMLMIPVIVFFVHYAISLGPVEQPLPTAGKVFPR